MGVRRVQATMLAVVCALATATPARAHEDTALISLSAGYYDQTIVNPGIGFFNVSSDKNKHKEAVDFRAEYRFGTSLLPAASWVTLKPWVGAEGTSDGGLYGVGGILMDVPLGPFVFTPSFGAGLYSNGKGKDLGYPIEFRTQFELGYAFENQSRVSLGYSHISNANLSENNHGTNVISLYYHIPMRWLFGQGQASE